VQGEVTHPSILDASYLKIILQSVESNSESTSETKKTKNEIAFSEKMQSKFEKYGTKKLGLSEKKSFSEKNYKRKVQFPHSSVLSAIILLVKAPLVPQRRLNCE
jgi:hypothetical protein